MAKKVVAITNAFTGHVLAVVSRTDESSGLDVARFVGDGLLVRVPDLATTPDKWVTMSIPVVFDGPPSEELKDQAQLAADEVTLDAGQESPFGEPRAYFLQRAGGVKLVKNGADLPAVVSSGRVIKVSLPAVPAAGTKFRVWVRVASAAGVSPASFDIHAKEATTVAGSADLCSFVLNLTPGTYTALVLVEGLAPATPTLVLT